MAYDVDDANVLLPLKKVQFLLVEFVEYGEPLMRADVKYGCGLCGVGMLL